MTTIGHFRREGDGFTGQFETLSREIAMQLVAANKFSAKAPDFTVLAGAVECGVAWRVTDTSGAVASIKIDDPAWPEPINARIMASEDGVLPLVWIRKAEAPPTSTSPSPPPPS